LPEKAGVSSDEVAKTFLTFQYTNNQDQLAEHASAEQEQLAQEWAKLEDERLKIQAELNELQERQAANLNTRAALISQLNEVNDYVASWDRYIAYNQSVRQVNLQASAYENRTPTADEYKQSLR
jgi:predicted  nucleic acid-binding Zn-ribbon protein